MQQKTQSRCRWVKSDPLLCHYHDREWGKMKASERQMWEHLILELFQSGLSWRTILVKRDNFYRAFDNFSPQKMASFTPSKIEELLKDKGIIRSKRKILSSVHNARVYGRMLENHESLSDIVQKALKHFRLTPPLRDVRPSSPLSEYVTTLLKKQGFKHIGAVTIQAWLQAIGIIDGHERACFLYDTDMTPNKP